jgi:hypothetical protein
MQGVLNVFVIFRHVSNMSHSITFKMPCRDDIGVDLWVNWQIECPPGSIGRAYRLPIHRIMKLVSRQADQQFALWPQTVRKTG